MFALSLLLFWQFPDCSLLSVHRLDAITLVRPYHLFSWLYDGSQVAVRLDIYKLRLAYMLYSLVLPAFAAGFLEQGHLLVGMFVRVVESTNLVVCDVLAILHVVCAIRRSRDPDKA